MRQVRRQGHARGYTSLLVATLLLTVAGCATAPAVPGQVATADRGPIPAGSVRVMPTRQYWRKAGTSKADADRVRQRCSQEMRNDAEYAGLLKEGAVITKVWHAERTAAQKKRYRQINARLGQLYDACMIGNGFEFVRRGFPVE